MIVASGFIEKYFNRRAQAAVTCLAPEVNLRRKKVSNHSLKVALAVSYVKDKIIHCGQNLFLEFDCRLLACVHSMLRPFGRLVALVC